jgi:hypothetical protein
MKWTTDLGSRRAPEGASSRLLRVAPHSGELHRITEQEWRALELSLDGGHVPADLAAKLARLNRDHLGHRHLERHCRLFLELLEASRERMFPGLSASQRQRLLLALAYVRKDEDAIPDYRPDGFTDDQSEVRAIAQELQPLLQAFKQWRLEHVVPRLWVLPEAAPRRLNG